MDPSDHDQNDLYNGAPGGDDGTTHANGPLGEDDRWLRSALENASEIVKVVDPDGTLRYASPAFWRILGHDPGEAVGRMNVLDHVHPDDLPHVLEETEKALSEGGVATNKAEYRFRHADGSWRWMEGVGTYLPDDPRVRGVVVNARDVTERKEAEAALKENEERHRIQSRELALLHQVRSALARELDLTSVFYEVVEATAETYGYTQVSAYMLEGEDLLLQHQVGYERVIERISVSEGVSGRTVRTGHPVLLEDVRTDPGFLGAIVGITSEICVPLFDEGRVVGCFNVESTGGVTLTQNDLELMVALGEHVSVAISRAQLHTRVRNSEEHFRALTQNSSDLITLLSAVGTIRYQSPSMERLLGYRPEETIEDNAFDYIHSDDRERVEMAFAEGLVDPGRRPSVEYRFRHKDGSWVWLESVGTNLLGDPEVGEYVVNSRDVTGRKETEWALRESERRFSSVVSDAHAYAYRCLNEPGWPNEYASDYALELTGYPSEDLLAGGKVQLGNLIVEEDRGRVWDEVQEALAEGRGFELRYAIRRRDGQIRHVHEYGRGIFGEDGGVVALEGLIYDVTEHREAEEALRKAEERYRTLVERIPAVTYVDRAEGSEEPLYVSPQVEGMLGYTAEEWMGGRLWRGRLHPEDRERILASDEHFGAHGGTVDEEYRLLAKDGSVVWVREEAVLVRGGGGEPLYVQGILSDITERKETERAVLRGETLLAESQRIAHLGTWEWDVVTGEVWWSDETYRIHGFEPGVGTTLRAKVEEAFFPEDLPAYRRKIDEALSGAAEGYDFRHRIRRPDGEVRWVHGQAEVVRGEGGKPLRMIGTVHDVTERKVLEERLEHQAFHDPLTDLPNRRLFLDRLGHALSRTERRRGRRVAVLFMDLDNFKGVNDSLGHEAGDLLLVVVAERLKRCLRPEDTLARFGGDEFVVVVEDVGDPDEALRVAERIGEGFGSPFVLEGRELYARASIGIALGDACDKTPEDLLRDADTAMYRAKESGAGYGVFDTAMYEQAINRLELENDVRRAIEKNEFVVHYQPIVRLDDGAVWGVEALVRWEHPERGLLDPDDFVPIAEESGLVVPMGELVLDEACRRAVEWQREFPRTPPLAMSVNLSGRQLRRPDLHEVIGRALKESGLSASSLGLDITETIYISALDANTAALDRLKALGIRISLDDFGSGYSSLSYLKRLPADILKIDKSFTKGLGVEVEDTAIVQTVVDLAHILGMEVVGEGVEIEEQETLLKEMGCDMAQGYLFAKPLPPEEVPGFLAG